MKTINKPQTRGWSTHSELNYFGHYTDDQKGVISWDDYITYGDNNPKWRALMRSGEGVVTSLDAFKGSCKIPSAIAQSNEPGAGYYATISGNVYTGVNMHPSSINKAGLNEGSVDNTADTLAQVNFAKSYRKRTRSWQSGVFAVELKQAIQMLANPARALREGFSELSKLQSRSTRLALKGRDLRTIAQKAKNNLQSKKQYDAIKAELRKVIAGTYLEWKFGIMPTLQDAMDASTAFRSMASGRTFDVVRCYGSYDSQSSIGYPVYFHPVSWNGFYLPSGKYNLDESVKYTSSTRIYGGWKNSNPAGYMPLPKIFGLSALDIIPTTWETIPYSWLVDYFINIGEVLDAWQIRSVDFEWLCAVTMREYIQVTRPPPPSWVDPNGGYPRYYDTAASGPLVVKARTLKRTSGVNELGTKFLVKIPGPGTKWLNILACAQQSRKPSHLRI